MLGCSEGPSPFPPWASAAQLGLSTEPPRRLPCKIPWESCSQRSTAPGPSLPRANDLRTLPPGQSVHAEGPVGRRAPGLPKAKASLPQRHPHRPVLHQPLPPRSRQPTPNSLRPRSLKKRTLSNQDATLHTHRGGQKHGGHDKHRTWARCWDAGRRHRFGDRTAIKTRPWDSRLARQSLPGTHPHRGQRQLQQACARPGSRQRRSQTREVEAARAHRQGGTPSSGRTGVLTHAPARTDPRGAVPGATASHKDTPRVTPLV